MDAFALARRLQRLGAFSSAPFGWADFQKQSARVQTRASRPKPVRKAVSAAAPAPKTIANFATGLIAAKPVKPCDRGVFGALDLLLFLKRNGRWRPVTARL